MADDSHEVVGPRRLTDADIARAAKEFQLPKAEVERIRKQHEQTAVTIEQRSFGVDDEARAGFHALYEREIASLKECPLPKIGDARRKSPARCRMTLRSFEHFLVHHHLHLMIDADSRTQRSTNESARELVHPTSEKTMKAALPAEERRRMMRDPELRRRLIAAKDPGYTLSSSSKKDE